MSVRSGGVGWSGVDPVDPVVFGEGALGEEAPGVAALGGDALGEDALAGGGFDAVALELVVVRCGDVPVRASQ